jgi:hypothetical protein
MNMTLDQLGELLQGRIQDERNKFEYDFDKNERNGYEQFYDSFNDYINGMDNVHLVEMLTGHFTCD